MQSNKQWNPIFLWSCSNRTKQQTEGFRNIKKLRNVTVNNNKTLAEVFHLLNHKTKLKIHFSCMHPFILNLFCLNRKKKAYRNLKNMSLGKCMLKHFLKPLNPISTNNYIKAAQTETSSSSSINLQLPSIMQSGRIW